mgnify:CR=1 FL=1
MELFESLKISKEELKNEIINEFQKRGLIISKEINPADKETYRRLQEPARLEGLLQHLDFLKKYYQLAFNYCRNGEEINPEKITLELRLVQSKTEEEILYNWWNLIWWSTPFQKSYGRRLRFLLWDTTHDALFGLIGLQSPLFRLAVRDTYLGIKDEEREIWINKSLEAHRVGALPPYNELLGGKLVALTLTCNEIREIYKEKYQNAVTVIKQRKLEPELLFITTMSAFGKSSLYNRLKFNDEIVAIKLGYTQGYGTFHVPHKLYQKILDFLKENGVKVPSSYFDGPSKKMQLLNTAFRWLDIPEFRIHGLKREVYLFPLAKNLKEVIQKNEIPQWIDRPFQKIVDFWKTRWAIPRSQRKPEWKNFNKNLYFKEIEKLLIDLKR